jgi:MtN3 and saliva related transmembrane protein
MSTIEIVGYFGSLLSSITFIPQVIKTWRSRSAGDLSLLMMCIVFTSTVVWLIYGIGLMLWPVILCNSIICALSLLLIFFKLTFKKQPVSN